MLPTVSAAGRHVDGCGWKGSLSLSHSHALVEQPPTGGFELSVLQNGRNLVKSLLEMLRCCAQVASESCERRARRNDIGRA